MSTPHPERDALRAALKPLADLNIPEGLSLGDWVARTLYCNRMITVHDVKQARAALAIEPAPEPQSACGSVTVALSVKVTPLAITQRIEVELPLAGNVVKARDGIHMAIVHCTPIVVPPSAVLTAADALADAAQLFVAEHVADIEGGKFNPACPECKFGVLLAAYRAAHSNGGKS